MPGTAASRRAGSPIRMIHVLAYLSSIEPCLPRPAKEPPLGPGWIHEIKHDGFRIMARRDGSRVRLISRNGHDLTYRFPSVATAIAALPVRSCLIDGEAIVCNGDGLLFFNSSATTVAEMPLRSVRST